MTDFLQTDPDAPANEVQDQTRIVAETSLPLGNRSLCIRKLTHMAVVN